MLISRVVGIETASELLLPSHKKSGKDQPGGEGKALAECFLERVWIDAKEVNS